ncbi:hypothetical protein D7B24_001804 [Verticillium nonalfalfae]|uniref:Major facilitator superfamily (MFS) profile domain-containing protein n=1 Tax=Verticillium nonalfalfae TaxID=1051616 RepID=A0A3M9YJ31_9PEZI|nr:uncharacterized protein D7B24_001804 [Verticillium nonalfalfae]RNJ59628.1 hypothetical protein D7B24_001804 [Verticillium nonalfalfae]
MSTTTVLAPAQSYELSSFRQPEHNGSTPQTPPGQVEDGQRLVATAYSRFSDIQKQSVAWFVAFCGLLASMSTTSILSAVPEIMETFDTTPTVINISNALYLVVIGLSSCFWGPLADTFGRKPVYTMSTTMFLLASIGTALSPTLVAFFFFRALTAVQVSTFLILGSSCISDIYHPIERATAMGWFLRGTVFGPAFGPIISGIIVTYTSWRIIFWVQASLSGLASLLCFFIMKETLQTTPRHRELRGQGVHAATKTLWKSLNPILVFRLLSEKNLLCVSLASASMAFNMYSLLTPIRYILNPRLGLTTPLQSGLLYLAPGGGYLLGSLIGGRLSDRIVKFWMKRRGFRLWEDRLRGSVILLGLTLPGSTLLYGWTVDRGFGGIGLPVVCMFVQGISQTSAFPSLNTYIMDVMQQNSGKASASHYFVRYALSAAATASCIPMIDAIGIGWTATISSSMVLAGSGLVLVTIHSGEKLSANVTRLSSVGHGILLKKHLWLRQYSASGVAGAIARGLRADATLVFGQEEAGTAICVDSSGILLTCAHCVAEVEEELDLESSHWLVFESGQIVEAKCVAWDGRRDLALLKVVAAQGMPDPQVSGGPKSSSQGRCGFPCALPDTSSPPLNDVLVCFGHPGSEDLESEQPGVATGYDVLVMSEGRFRGYAEGQDPQDNEKIGALKHDCWTYWGHSGAPLFRKRSKLLVGLHSSWDDETGMRRGVPVEAISDFLVEHSQHLGRK